MKNGGQTTISSRLESSARRTTRASNFNDLEKGVGPLFPTRRITLENGAQTSRLESSGRRTNRASKFNDLGKGVGPLLLRPLRLGPVGLVGRIGLVGLVGLVVLTTPAFAQPQPTGDDAVDPASVPGDPAADQTPQDANTAAGTAAAGMSAAGTASAGTNSGDAGTAGTASARTTADSAESLPDPDAVPPPFAPWSTARLALELDLVSHARYASKAGANLSEIRLDRGELGARLGLGRHGAAELRLETIRSAIEGGALGIDGDSMVVRIRFATVGGSVELGPVRLEGALGFVPDPWLRTLEDGYTLRPLSRSGSERLLGWLPSDLSAMVRGEVGPARLTVTVGNGEGQRYPERNTGKTTTAVAEVVAVNRRSLRLSIAAVGRDGSVGVARVRDRRAGGGATVITPWARAGVEVVKAWGIGDRGDAEGLEAGGWVDVRVGDRVSVSARGASLGFTAGGRVSTFGGAIAVEPWRDAKRATYRVWLAVDRLTSSGDAMPLPGADAGDATVAMLILSAVAPLVLD